MKLPGISKLGKIKGLKREKNDTAISEVAVSEEPQQEKKSIFSALKKLNIKRNKEKEVRQEVMQEQVLETQEPLLEATTEEFVQESQSKIGFSRKKIIIIIPIVAIAVILGLPFSGILPENQYLPNVIGLVTGGDLGDMIGQIPNIRGSDLSEKIDELEFKISNLEDRVAGLEEQLSITTPQNLVGSQGPIGPQGIQGQIGPAGPQGELGASTVPIMLTLGERSTSVPNTIFIGQGFGALDYNAAKILIPLDGTMKNLFVTVSKAPNTDIDFTLIKNGFDTDLTCTLNSSTDCSDKVHAINIKAGDTFAVKVSKDFPVNIPQFNIQVSMTLEQS